MIKAENEVQQLKNGLGVGAGEEVVQNEAGQQLSTDQANATDMAVKFKLHILECKIIIHLFHLI